MFWGYRILVIELERILLKLRKYRKFILKHWFWDIEQRIVCLRNAWQWDVCTDEEQRDVYLENAWQRDVCAEHREEEEQRDVCLKDAW